MPKIPKSPAEKYRDSIHGLVSVNGVVIYDAFANIYGVPPLTNISQLVNIDDLKDHTSKPRKGVMATNSESRRSRRSKA